MSTVTAAGEGFPLATYTYDALSRRATALYANNALATFTYEDDNDLSRIEQAVNGGSYSLDYAYNAVGQQTGLTLGDAQYLWRPPANGTAASSAPNPLNQLPDFSGNTLSYDANGNLTNDGTSTLTYDVENRLAAVTSATQTATFTYDPSGRRSSRTLDGVETRFLWSDEQEIAEYDVSGLLIRRFVPGPGLGRPVAMVEFDNSRYFYHYDAVGSVVALSDAGGQIVARYAYSAWGETIEPAGLIAAANPFRFAGYRYEPAIGLYHLRARDYSPAMGRFLQPDPIGYQAGMNLYLYVDNDPLNLTDPSGKCPWCIGAAGGAIVGLGAQAWSDFANGNAFQWQNYAGAAAGGATTGGLLFTTFNPAAAGAAGAAVQNGVTQLANRVTGRQNSFDATSFVVDTTIGAAAGGAFSKLAKTGVFPGLRNQYASLSKQIQTKIQNSTIQASNLRPTTSAKVFLGAAPQYVPAAVAAPVISGVSNAATNAATSLFSNTGQPTSGSAFK